MPSHSGDTTPGIVTLSDGQTISYLTAGTKGPTVLFVPGWMMAKEIFEFQARHALEHGTFRHVAIDPRGQGASSKGFTSHHHDCHAVDVHEVIEALGLGKVVLAGWSAAVLTVMSYIRQFGTADIEAVILIDGTPRPVGDPGTDWCWYTGRLDDEGLIAFTSALTRDRPTQDDVFATWMLETPTPEKRQRIISMAQQTPDAIAALLCWENASHRDESDTLVSLEGRLPLLYMMREEWRDLVTDWARSNTPSARVEAFGSHLMFWEQPDRFNQLLDAFLGDLTL